MTQDHPCPVCPRVFLPHGSFQQTLTGVRELVHGPWLRLLRLYLVVVIKGEENIDLQKHTAQSAPSTETSW